MRVWSHGKRKLKGRDLEAATKILRSRDKARRRAKFAEWVSEMVYGPVGKLQKLSKEEGPIGGMLVHWDEDTNTFIADPNVILVREAREGVTFGNARWLKPEEEPIGR